MDNNKGKGPTYFFWALVILLGLLTMFLLNDIEEYNEDIDWGTVTDAGNGYRPITEKEKDTSSNVTWPTKDEQGNYIYTNNKDKQESAPPGIPVDDGQNRKASDQKHFMDSQIALPILQSTQPNERTYGIPIGTYNSDGVTATPVTKGKLLGVMTPNGGFGDRNITNQAGLSKSSTFHRGNDYPFPGGTPVLAVDSGVILRSGNTGTTGNGQFIEIDHGNGVRTVYLHLSKRIAVMQQRVSKGQVIGLVGTTGTSSGNHLHFGIGTLHNGAVIYADPQKVIFNTNFGTVNSNTPLPE